MAGFARVTFERDPSRSGGVGLHVGPTALQRVRSALTFFALACFVALASAPASHAQTYVVTLDPAQTRVEFALGTTLHTVHGTFQLISGQIHFDAATGKASGTIVVDARSADTDNKSRDKKMHQEILESPKYPEIVFTSAQVRGSFDPQKVSQVDVSGVMRIHGQDHDFTMTLAVQLVPGSQLQCDTQFTIPYIKWGMKDPSTFLLHANDKVELEIHAIAKIIPDQPAH
jgi:polyisoprenoid-binding protein YceI